MVEHTGRKSENDTTVVNKGKTYILLGWVFAVVSIFFIPILFGTLGVTMGISANRKGVKGTPVIIGSIVLALIGIALEAVLAMFFGTYLQVMTIMY